jgi:hypothetical protein
MLTTWGQFRDDSPSVGEWAHRSADEIMADLRAMIAAIP